MNPLRRKASQGKGKTLGSKKVKLPKSLKLKWPPEGYETVVVNSTITSSSGRKRKETHADIRKVIRIGGPGSRPKVHCHR